MAERDRRVQTRNRAGLVGAHTYPGQGMSQAPEPANRVKCSVCGASRAPGGPSAACSECGATAISIELGLVTGVSTAMSLEVGVTPRDQSRDWKRRWEEAE